jgi:hypothetical protein
VQIPTQVDVHHAAKPYCHPPLSMKATCSMAHSRHATCRRAPGGHRLTLTNCIIFSCYEQCLPSKLHSCLSHCQPSSEGIARFCCQLSAVVDPAGYSICNSEYPCCMPGLFHCWGAVPET